eukprot:SAG25_NODE_2452_length_1595_cov_2.019385_1_plen_92_part_00
MASSHTRGVYLSVIDLPTQLVAVAPADTTAADCVCVYLLCRSMVVVQNTVAVEGVSLFTEGVEQFRAKEASAKEAMVRRRRIHTRAGVGRT